MMLLSKMKSHIHLRNWNLLLPLTAAAICASFSAADSLSWHPVTIVVVSTILFVSGLITWTALERFPDLPFLQYRDFMIRWKVYISVSLKRVFLLVLFIFLFTLMIGAAKSVNNLILRLASIMGLVVLTLLLIAVKHPLGTGHAEYMVKDYIKCCGCDWFGSLADLKACEGVCPGCGSYVFMFPEYISHGPAKGIDSTMTLVRYQFKIHSDLSLGTILTMRKKIWKEAPRRWWDPESDSNWRALWEFYEGRSR